MGDTVIKVEGISKKYCRSLKHTMLYGVTDLSKSFVNLNNNSEKLRDGEFWGLDNVSFELKRGETLGIVGPNGSGKSTLLKMLNGIFMPDIGEIEVSGQMGALIEVGAGFHPMLTGRENIYVNGSILGLTKKEIDEKFDAIVNFAEIGEFIDSPVKHYSSGMRVRLGFAVAAQIGPDILLIDEVLAVGDFNFRQKCSKKINELKRDAAVVIVSHSIRDITMLCTNVIVLNKGKAVFQGAADEAVDYYMEMIEAEEEAIKREKECNETIPSKSIYEVTCHDSNRISNIQHKWLDEKGKPVKTIEHGKNLSLHFSFKLLQPVTNLIIGIPILDEKGKLITSFNTDMNRIKIKVNDDGTVAGKLNIKDLVFNPGIYNPILAVQDGKEYIYRELICGFKVKEMPFHYGYITPLHSWEFDAYDDK